MGWGSLRTADVSPRSSPLRNVSAAMSEEKRLSFERLGVGRKGEESALEREKLGFGLGLGFGARHAT